MSQILVTGEAKIRDIQGPVVANSGVITALDGAASQYVRGDGTLADFPTSSGGGSSVSYYLNSSVSQGTIGGVAYRELSKDPIIGAGTDIAISANGYVANYITDANDPDVILVPGGNFNCEFYFSVNNNTGNPTTYAELYKYDGTTFTLLGTSAGVPESINQGTTIAPYYFAIPVATAALSVTDRLAIRIYVNVDSRTVTLHTENGHLCQVVTTLSKGMVSLNNLTDQSQYLATGTSGTNFAIVSSGDTHTFNLPVASATNTGKLSSTDWSTFNGKVPYTGATASVDLGTYGLNAGAITTEAGYAFKILAAGTLFQNGYSVMSSLEGNISLTQAISAGNLKAFTFDFSAWAANTTRTFTLPDASGTLALTSNLSAYVPYTGATTNVDLGGNSLYLNNGQAVFGRNFTGTTAYALIGVNPSNKVSIDTSALGAVFGGSLTGQTYIANGIGTQGGTIALKQNGLLSASTGYTTLGALSAGQLVIYFGDTNAYAATFLNTSLTASQSYTLPNLSGTLALLEGTQTFSGAKTFTENPIINGTGTNSAYTILQSAGTNKWRIGNNYAAGVNTFDIFAYDNTTTPLSINSNGAMTLTANVTTTGAQFVQNGLYLTNANGGALAGYTHMWAADDGINFGLRNITGGARFIFQSATSYNYTFPAATGTLALTSNLSAYLPLTGGTLTGALSGTSATFSGNFGVGTATPSVYTNLNTITINGTNGSVIDFKTGEVLYGELFCLANELRVDAVGASGVLKLLTNSVPRLTIASTGAATFSSSVTAGGLITKTAGSAAALLMNDTSGNNKWEMGWEATSNNFYIYSYGGGISPFRITSGGNVGIGTSSPATKLDVSGTIRPTGQTDPTSGVGMELFYRAADTSSYIQSYDRTNGAWKDVRIYGNTLYFGSQGTNNLTIGSNGNIGIGVTNSSVTRLLVQGVDSTGSNYVFVATDSAATNLFFVRNDGYMYFGLSANSPYNIAQAGRSCILASNGSVGYLVSTRESKANIQSIKNVDFINKLNPVQFNYRKKDDKSNTFTDELEENITYGFIADEVEKVNKDLVFYDNLKDGSKKLAGVEYNNMIAVLTKAVQELKAEIEILKNK